ncbi:hypothetical protein Tco_0690337 [Tanacetum coccineum]
MSHIIRELKQSNGKEQPKKKGETSGNFNDSVTTKGNKAKDNSKLYPSRNVVSTFTGDENGGGRPLNNRSGDWRPSMDSIVVDVEEFYEKHYEKLLPIMADKYGYEQRKKEKLEEVKARLDFGDARKKSTRAQESAYSESRTISPKLGSRGRSTSAHSDSCQESSRYTENHSESEDSEGGHWKSKLRRKKSSVKDDDLSQH